MALQENTGQRSQWVSLAIHLNHRTIVTELDTMKNFLPTLGSVLLLVLMLPASAAAQTEMTIPWTGVPGELETTIVADTLADGMQAHDVYILEKGRVYLQIDPIDVNGSFTVRGQMYDPADPTDVPATIQPLPGPDGVSRYVVWPGAHFNLLGDGATLKLENLLFNGAMADQSTHVWSIALTFGSNQRVEVENNVWSDYQMTLMSQGSNSDFLVNNTIVKAVPSYPGGVFFNGFIWGGGSWLGTIDTLVVTNSSVMNFWGEAIVIYEQVEHGLVDHTSFVNMVMRPIFNRGGNNMTFSNNLMYNTKIFGQSTYFYGLWGSIDGGSGVMDINYQDPPDSAAMAAGRHWDHLNRNIVWHNNAWVNDEQVLDFWQKGPWEWEVINEDGETEVRRDTMLAIEVQNKFLGDSTLALMAADPSIREYDNVQTTPTLLLNPEYLRRIIQRITDFRDNEAHDTFLDEWWQFEHDNDPINVEWPIHEDLRYAYNSPAATASETGGPVGDPRWVPYTNVNVEEEGVPSSFSLDQNYPNPFNPSTDITFSLNQLSDVRLVIYNVLGQPVSELVKGSLPAGTYKVRWDGTSSAGHRVASGVYLYTLSTGNVTASKMMTLIK